MKLPVSRRQFLAQSAAVTFAAGTVGRAAEAKAFRPRYSICNETFGKMEFPEAFAIAAECGYEGIEFAPFTVANDITTVTAQQRTTIKRQLKEAGLVSVGLHWLLARTKGLHLTSPDREVRRKTTAYLGELARFLADIGGGKLIFGSPQQRNLQPGVELDDAYKYADEVITELLPQLEATDTTLAFEPLSHRTTNFMSTAAGAMRLVDAIDSPRVNLILDCLAMSSEEIPIPELIRANRKKLVHFHANDPNRRGPGFGELDFVPIFTALRDIEYSGWVSVEVFDYKPGAEKLARESIGYMKRIAKEVSS